MSFEYLEAASAVTQILAKTASTKNAIYGTGSRNIRRVFALVMETMKKVAPLQVALASCGLADSNVEAGLLLVLSYELLYGAKSIKGGGAARKLVMEQEGALRRSLRLPPRGEAAASAAEVGRGREAGRGGDDSKPRWLRVNTLKTSVPQAIAALTMSVGEAPCLAPSEVVRDGDVPVVLRLPPGAHGRLNLHAHPLVTSGGLVMQDLASAMPVAALLDDWTATAGEGRGVAPFDAVDCCAAPGNKTTQLAAALAEMFGGGSAPRPSKRGRASDGSAASGPAFTVHAFDRDAKRLDLLQARVQEAGAGGIVSATCADFLTVDTSAGKYGRVRAVLLDPSCSGSGMPDAALGVKGAPGAVGAAGAAKAGFMLEAPASVASRVKSLADFQLRALLHALTFPALSRLVYSTCSVYAAEDEGVVAAALAACAGEDSPAGGRAVKLVRALGGWPRRGIATNGLTASQADCCVRCHPLDGTTGFFLAVFELA
jgi:putative methyltransferase